MAGRTAAAESPYGISASTEHRQENWPRDMPPPSASSLPGTPVHRPSGADFRLSRSASMTIVPDFDPVRRPSPASITTCWTGRTISLSTGRVPAALLRARRRAGPGGPVRRGAGAWELRRAVRRRGDSDAADKGFGAYSAGATRVHNHSVPATARPPAVTGSGTARTPSSPCRAEVAALGPAATRWTRHNGLSCSRHPSPQIRCSAQERRCINNQVGLQRAG